MGELENLEEEVGQTKADEEAPKETPSDDAATTPSDIYDADGSQPVNPVQDEPSYA